MASVFFKKGKWYLSYKGGNGARCRHVSRAATKTEARRLAQELERKCERERLGLEPAPVRCDTKLWELCESWLAGLPPNSVTYRERKRLERHVMARLLGSLELPKVTAGKIEERLVEMERDGLAPASVNKLRSVLHVVFKRAIRAGIWTGPNPLDAVQVRRVPMRAYSTLQADEVPLLLAQVPLEWRCLFATAIWTGMRKGELFGLRKIDVDLVNKIILVTRSYDHPTTKGGHVDAIPIAYPLLPYLQKAIADSKSELVFPDPSGAMRTEGAGPQKILRTAMAHAGLVAGYLHVCRRCAAQGKPHEEKRNDPMPRICPACGMKLWVKAIHRPMRFHDLRHSAGTLLLRAGVDPHRVQRILRHKDIRTTLGTYGHLVVEDLREAVNKIGPPGFKPKYSAPEAPAALDKTDSFIPQVSPSQRARRRNTESHLKTLGRSGLSNEREKGFEPSTLALARRCSTTELFPLKKTFILERSIPATLTKHWLSAHFGDRDWIAYMAQEEGRRLDD